MSSAGRPLGRSGHCSSMVWATTAHTRRKAPRRSRADWCAIEASTSDVRTADQVHQAIRRLREHTARRRAGTAAGPGEARHTGDGAVCQSSTTTPVQAVQRGQTHLDAGSADATHPDESWLPPDGRRITIIVRRGGTGVEAGEGRDGVQFVSGTSMSGGDDG